jgi:trk system potassium uptake protein TrkA
LARLDSSGVIVIGMGRFGESLARELMASGTEVMGIDADEKIIQKMAGVLTHVVVADATDEEALRQLGVHEFERVVVGIGQNLEASILTCSVLQAMGIKDVWGKAISAAHGKILSQLGVQHVVRPEHDTGRRVAHLVAGRMLDYIEFDDGFAIVKMRPPKCVLDEPLAQSKVRTKYGVTIVGVKREGEDFTHATQDTVVHDGDLIIVSGARSKVEDFSEMR